jgi:hypothetical protein
VHARRLFDVRSALLFRRSSEAPLTVMRSCWRWPRAATILALGVLLVGAKQSDGDNDDSGQAQRVRHRGFSVFKSKLGEEKYELACPKRHFVARLVWKKGTTREHWNGSEWHDMAWEFECRPFRKDDDVGGPMVVDL